MPPLRQPGRPGHRLRIGVDRVRGEWARSLWRNNYRFASEARLIGHLKKMKVYQIAAGPNYLVEVVDSQIAIYTKDGVRLSSQPLSAFFNTGSPAPTLPLVFYDDLTNRFVVAAMQRDSI